MCQIYNMIDNLVRYSNSVIEIIALIILIKTDKMGSIETIELRLSSKLSPALEKDISEIIEKALGAEEVSEIKLYNKERIDTDYLIILIYKKQYSEKQTKALGQLLKATLKEYGMVYHNYWSEII